MNYEQINENEQTLSLPNRRVSILGINGALTNLKEKGRARGMVGRVG